MNTSATILDELRNTFQNAGDEVEKSLVANLKLGTTNIDFKEKDVVKSEKSAETPFIDTPFIVHAQVQKGPKVSQRLERPVSYCMVIWILNFPREGYVCKTLESFLAKKRNAG